MKRQAIKYRYILMLGSPPKEIWHETSVIGSIMKIQSIPNNSRMRVTQLLESIADNPDGILTNAPL